MHSDTSRHWLERPFSSFVFSIYLNWSHSWLYIYRPKVKAARKSSAYKVNIPFLMNTKHVNSLSYYKNNPLRLIKRQFAKFDFHIARFCLGYYGKFGFIKRQMSTCICHLNQSKPNRQCIKYASASQKDWITLSFKCSWDKPASITKRGIHNAAIFFSELHPNAYTGLHKAERYWHNTSSINIYIFTLQLPFYYLPTQLYA